MNAPAANLNSSRYEFACDALQSLLPSLPSKTVLDIGAGDGRMSRIQGMGFQWLGFDLKPSPGISYWDLTSPCPVKEPNAGAAILLDVIEHCANPGLALSNIARVLAPNARLILTMPNPRWSRSRVHSLLHGYPACFTQTDLVSNHHVFTPWPHIMEKLLNDAGFEVDEYVTLDGSTRLLDKPITRTYPAKCLFRLLLMGIERVDISARGMSYGLIARRTTPGMEITSL